MYILLQLLNWNLNTAFKYNVFSITLFVLFNCHPFLILLTEMNGFNLSASVPSGAFFFLFRIAVLYSADVSA